MKTYRDPSKATRCFGHVQEKGTKDGPVQEEMRKTTEKKVDG